MADVFPLAREMTSTPQLKLRGELTPPTQAPEGSPASPPLAFSPRKRFINRTPRTKKAAGLQLGREGVSKHSCYTRVSPTGLAFALASIPVQPAHRK